MPWTANRVSVKHAFRERSTVVRTRRSDREHVVTVARKQHRVVADVAQQHAAVSELGQRNAPREIRALQLPFVAAHLCDR